MVKKPRNKKPNNKGSALFYVMLMLMVVTIILSGALYASYRNALVTNNYSSSESDYVACDSALEALRGQLAARLVGDGSTSYKGINTMTGANVDSTFIFKDDVADGYYDNIKNNEYLPLDMSSYADYKGFYVYRIDECVGIIKCQQDGQYNGFRVEDSNSIDDFFVIKDVIAEYGSVRVTTDIVVYLDLKDQSSTNDDVFKSVQFQNYKITSVIPEQTPDNPEEGGEQQ